jgi:hypothetical protein
VEVTVCRRLASQLEIRFLKKVLNRSVTQEVVDEFVSRIEEVLHGDHAGNDRPHSDTADRVNQLEEVRFPVSLVTSKLYAV